MEEEATIPGHYCILEGDGRTDQSYCVLRRSRRFVSNMLMRVVPGARGSHECIRQ